MCVRGLIVILGAGGLSAASAKGSDCDRACLGTIADQVLRSMAAHDASKLPVAVPYMATENGRSAMLTDMSLWRTLTWIAERRLVAIDPGRGQVFISAEVKEGGPPSIMNVRIKVKDRAIAEFEGFIIRAKSDGSINFIPPGVSDLAVTWGVPVPAAQRASRDELERVGRSDWDPNFKVAVAPGCQIYENGENIGAHGPCLETTRNVEPKARLVVTDEEQGLTVSIGHLYGTITTGGTFIPEASMDKIRASSTPPKGPEFLNILREQPGTNTVIMVDKYVGGRMRGKHLLHYVQAPGATSIWVEGPR